MVDKQDRSKALLRTKNLFVESIALKQKVIEQHLGVIVQMAEIITQSIQKGGKVMLCGNGGSAADAQHIAAELLVRLRPHVNRAGLPALALAGDMSSLTAHGNDYEYVTYYERMVQTLGQPGDVLVGISTSGSSENIVKALNIARQKNIHALGLLGGNGGNALKECECALVVPSTTTGRIQEVHITAGHAIAELVEDALLESEYIRCL